MYLTWNALSWPREACAYNFNSVQFNLKLCSWEVEVVYYICWSMSSSQQPNGYCLFMQVVGLLFIGLLVKHLHYNCSKYFCCRVSPIFWGSSRISVSWKVCIAAFYHQFISITCILRRVSDVYHLNFFFETKHVPNQRKSDYAVIEANERIRMFNNVIKYVFAFCCRGSRMVEQAPYWIQNSRNSSHIICFRLKTHLFRLNLGQ